MSDPKRTDGPARHNGYVCWAETVCTDPVHQTPSPERGEARTNVGCPIGTYGCATDWECQCTSCPACVAERGAGATHTVYQPETDEEFAARLGVPVARVTHAPDPVRDAADSARARLLADPDSLTAEGRKALGLPPVKRGRARVCGDCWYVLRPGEYAPERGSSDAGECSLCGEYHWTLYRVSWAEVDAAMPPVRNADGRTILPAARGR